MFQLTLLDKKEIEIVQKKKRQVKNLKPLFTSNSDDWATDPVLFNQLNKIFKFETDLAAGNQNNKCEKYYFSVAFCFIPWLREVWIKACGGIMAHSSLAAPWVGSCWLNPPYSNIDVWAKKAFEVCMNDKKTLIAFLIPSRTDTKYFKDFCFKARYIVYLHGRQKFGRGRQEGKGSAPFPSCLVLFGAYKSKNVIMDHWTLKRLSELGQVTENLNINRPGLPPGIKRKIITNAKDLK